ncbi:MAG: autotransporter outer membrane beta-barrel domain-containing protein [Treponema sp.]|nr:autotransporter outer membrane beta-barrel domain-containing protein [Treponema sp.]
MAKKFTLFLVFFLLVSGLVFADENIAFPRSTLTGFISSSFGIGLQYEFQINKNFSVGGRFEYKGLGIFSFDDNNHIGFFDTSSILVHAFGRYYPFTGTFFLDGMIGYANLKYQETPLTHHLSYSVRLGWRIDFGKPGGFVLEPTFGYYSLLGKNNLTYIERLPWLPILSTWALLGDVMRDMMFLRGFVISIGIGCRF